MLSQTGSPVHLRSSAALVSRNSDSSHNSRAGHPGWLRCSSLTYSRYARSSRLAIRAPRSGTYATNHCYGTLDRRALRILQREPELLRERVDRRARALPRAFGLEAQVADAAAPRRDHAADGPEIRPVRVLLIENADDVGRDADERAQGRRRADAVLASIPRAAEHERDLLEVIDEEFLRLFVDVARAAAGEHAALGEELLQLLRERRLRDAAAADAQQLDFIVERRVLAIVERTRDVVSRRQRFVPIQLPAREADQVRRVQPGVLRVDRDEHLHDVIFRQPVEDDRRHREILALKALDVGVQREQPVLAVNRAQNAFTLGDLEDAHALVAVHGLKRQLLVAGDDDGARDRRQVARLTTLFVILHELVDLAPDDLALVRLLARRDAPLEEIPVHLRRRHPGLLLAATNRRLRRVAVTQHFESNELVDVTRRQRSLIELHAELLHADRG